MTTFLLILTATVAMTGLAYLVVNYLADQVEAREERWTRRGN